jgi:hypothetical protein
MGDFILRIVGNVALQVSAYRIVVATSITTLLAIPLHRSFALDGSHIKQIEESVVNHVCSNTSWLTCWGDNPASCSEIIRRVASSCLKQFLPTVPQEVQYQEARETGIRIVECINKEFASSRPFGKKNSEECRDIPEHLK